MNTPERDNLDEFLRRSLEEYEDSPPDSLWSRIETEANPVSAPTPVPARRLSARYYRWVAGIAASLLVGVIVAQHCYYQAQLRLVHRETPEMYGKKPVLPKTHDNNNATSETGVSPYNNTTEGVGISPEPHTDATGKTDSSALFEVSSRSLRSGDISKRDNSHLSVSEVPSRSLRSGDISKTGNSRLSVFEGSSRSLRSSDEKTSQEVTFLAPPKMTPLQDGSYPKTDILPDDIATTNKTSILPDNKTAGNISVLPYEYPLLPLRTAILKAPTVAVQMPLQVPVKIQKPARHWVLGLYAQTVTTRLTLPKEPERPPFPLPVKRRLETAPNPGQGWGLGWTAGVEFGRRWRIQSGIQYSGWSEKAILRPEFSLKDGRGRGPMRGNGNHDDYEFNYALRSVGGESSITLLVAPADQSVPRKPTDAVRLELETNRRLAEIVVPLSAQYRFGSGRFRPTLRAGLAVAIRTFDEVTISKFTSTEATFRATANPPKFSTPDQTGQVTANWQVGAGLEYRLTPTLAVFAEPVATGDFQRQQTFVPGVKPPQPQRTYLSFNLGILKSI